MQATGLASFVVVVWLLGRWPAFEPGMVPFAIALGALGVISVAALYRGLALGPVAVVAPVVASYVVITVILVVIFLGERLTRNKVAGVACATVGAIVVVASAQSGAALSSQRLIGDLLMVGGAACWSVYATLGAITTRTGSPLGVTAVACLAGSAMLFPFGFLEHGYRDVPAWPIGAWLDIAYLVIFATIVGFVLFYYAVRRFGAGLASMVSYLVPVFALVQASLFLNERITVVEVAGGAIILVGVRLATWRTAAMMPLEDAASA